MQRLEVYNQIVKRLAFLSKESLHEVLWFLHFMQMRERIKPGMEDIGLDLTLNGRPLCVGLCFLPYHATPAPKSPFAAR